MSNYSKTTDFAAKDSLPSGDSGKIIRGSEFETEFDAISTAIATKADAADPTFTGTVTIDGLTVNGNTVLGNADTDTVTVTADIASNLIPSADDTYNLGASGAEWNDLFIDGTANIDSLVADTADINGGTIDGVTIGGSSAGAITGTTITGTGFVTSGDMTFGDNNKAIFGAGSDLQIYHDGSNSRIQDAGTGNLLIRANAAVQIENTNGDNMLFANAGGSVDLYHNSSKKLETTSTGIDVTGTVTADGLTVDGATDGTAVALFRADNNGVTKKNTLRFEDTDTTTQNDQQIGRIEFYSNDTDHTGVDAVIEAVSATTGLKELRFLTSYTANTPLSRLAINKSGDISFYEDTGTTAKLFWDASEESLGIGTSSSSSKLTIDTGGNTTADYIDVNTAGSSRLRIGYSFTGSPSNIQAAQILVDSSGNLDLSTRGNAASNLILYTSSGSTPEERMRIDSSGNVGIGTSSPATALHVQGSVQGGDQAIIESTNGGAASGPQLNLKRSSASPADNDPIGMLKFTGNNSALAEHEFARIAAVMNDVTDTTEDGSLLFSTSSAGSISEAMRISSGGHLLVGKTAQDQTNTVGFEAKDDGLAVATTDGSQSLILNRKTSDGTIAEFRKDNIAVGSIGTTGGDLFIGTGDTTLRYNDGSDTISPAGTNGAARDGLLNLGNSANRFKDLFLSGGAYLGGTAAANKLDDYEEGTWTPELADASSGGNTATGTANGWYTKIGNLVTIGVRLLNVDTTGMTSSNDLFIRGLPFASSSTSYGNVGGALLDRITFTGYVVPVQQSGASHINLRDVSSGAFDANLLVSSITSTGSDIELLLQYKTA